jgi:hypothetical protein
MNESTRTERCRRSKGASDGGDGERPSLVSAFEIRFVSHRIFRVFSMHVGTRNAAPRRPDGSSANEQRPPILEAAVRDQQQRQGATAIANNSEKPKPSGTKKDSRAALRPSDYSSHELRCETVRAKLCSAVARLEILYEESCMLVQLRKAAGPRMKQGFWPCAVVAVAAETDAVRNVDSPLNESVLFLIAESTEEV